MQIIPVYSINFGHLKIKLKDICPPVFAAAAIVVAHSCRHRTATTMGPDTTTILYMLEDDVHFIVTAIAMI
jgi:hypothetical protein